MSSWEKYETFNKKNSDNSPTDIPLDCSRSSFLRSVHSLSFQELWPFLLGYRRRSQEAIFLTSTNLLSHSGQFRLLQESKGTNLSSFFCSRGGAGPLEPWPIGSKAAPNKKTSRSKWRALIQEAKSRPFAWCTPIDHTFPKETNGGRSDFCWHTSVPGCPDSRHGPRRAVHGSCDRPPHRRRRHHVFAPSGHRSHPRCCRRWPPSITRLHCLLKADVVLQLLQREASVFVYCTAHERKNTNDQVESPLQTLPKAQHSHLCPESRRSHWNLNICHPHRHLQGARAPSSASDSGPAWSLQKRREGTCLHVNERDRNTPIFVQIHALHVNAKFGECFVSPSESGLTWKYRFTQKKFLSGWTRVPIALDLKRHLSMQLAFLAEILQSYSKSHLFVWNGPTEQKVISTNRLYFEFYDLIWKLLYL